VLVLLDDESDDFAGDDDSEEDFDASEDAAAGTEDVPVERLSLR
jgi:hypothetical protein